MEGQREARRSDTETAGGRKVKRGGGGGGEVRRGTQAAVRSEGGKCLGKKKKEKRINKKKKTRNTARANNWFLSNREGQKNEAVVEEETRPAETLKERDKERGEEKKTRLQSNNKNKCTSEA